MNLLISELACVHMYVCLCLCMRVRSVLWQNPGSLKSWLSSVSSWKSSFLSPVSSLLSILLTDMDSSRNPYNGACAPNMKQCFGMDLCMALFQRPQ